MWLHCQLKEGIFLSQRKYVLDLLEEVGMSACKPVSTPSEVGLKLCVKEDQVPVDKGQYQRLVGRLMYLSHTRPDLAYSLSIVTRFMHCPGKEHLEAVLRILRYLKGTPGKGVWFKKNEGTLDIKVFTDADWGGDRDDGRSTSGYFTFVGGNLVTWRCKKQAVVARSSAEAELRGMVHGLAEGMWLQLLLKDLGLCSSLPIRLYCDNKAARDVVYNPVQHDRMKHVEIDRFFLKEKLEGKVLELPVIRTEEQIADILTKAVTVSVFEKMLDKLGMLNIHSQLEGECEETIS